MQLLLGEQLPQAGAAARHHRRSSRSAAPTRVVWRGAPLPVGGEDAAARTAISPSAPHTGQHRAACRGLARDILTAQQHHIEGDPLAFLNVTESYWEVRSRSCWPVAPRPHTPWGARTREELDSADVCAHSP